jgi:MFS family permease
MNWFRQPIKYFAPLFFLLGYAVYLVPSVTMILLGSAFIGIANGVGTPYLNTIASIKGGRNSATTVMPLLSAALYLGQFVSPLVVLPLSATFFGEDDMTAPYKTGILLCLLLLLQVWATRHYQSLPPK